MPLYIARAEAYVLYAESDPDVDESHLYQGDIIEHVNNVHTPGSAQEWAMLPVMVVSRDCEYTKGRSRPHELTLSIAPLRPVARIPDPGHQQLVRDNRIKNLLWLPAEGVLDEEFAVDLRLTQPMLTAELQRAAESGHLTCLGPVLRRALEAKITEYFTNEETLRELGT